MGFIYITIMANTAFVPEEYRGHPLSLQEVGTSCVQLFLQFYVNSFEILQVFWKWSSIVHVV